MIWLVEDHDPDVLLIKEALDAGGVRYTLERWRAATEAIAALAAREHLPDLVLLDLNLPGVSGWAVLRYIRSHPSLARIRVAVLTSSDLPEDRTQAEQLGAAFVTKPPLLDLFLHTVSAAVRRLLATGAAGLFPPRADCPASSQSRPCCRPHGYERPRLPHRHVACRGDAADREPRKMKSTS
ncbi:MAG: response regulator [Acidobacteria bacterium]|nr:response regulator [Acidobacteriota bacterium]